MFGQTPTSYQAFEERMRSVSVTMRYLALGLGIAGAVLGVAVHGVESGILWSLIGYFLGKAVQSTFRAVTGS